MYCSRHFRFGFLLLWGILILTGSVVLAEETTPKVTTTTPKQGELGKCDKHPESPKKWNCVDCPDAYSCSSPRVVECTATTPTETYACALIESVDKKWSSRGCVPFNGTEAKLGEWSTYKELKTHYCNTDCCNEEKYLPLPGKGSTSSPSTSTATTNRPAVPALVVTLVLLVVGYLFSRFLLNDALPVDTNHFC